MIENELLEWFSKLDENEKRNQISAEFEKLGLLLQSIHEKYGIPRMSNAINSYNKATDSNMENSNYFNLIYQDIIFIRKDILTLVNSLMTNKNENIQE